VKNEPPSGISTKEFNVFGIASAITPSVGGMQRLMNVADKVHNEGEGLLICDLGVAGVSCFRVRQNRQEMIDLNQGAIAFASGSYIRRRGFKACILDGGVDEMPRFSARGGIWKDLGHGGLSFSSSCASSSLTSSGQVAISSIVRLPSSAEIRVAAEVPVRRFEAMMAIARCASADQQKPFDGLNSMNAHSSAIGGWKQFSFRIGVGPLLTQSAIQVNFGPRFQFFLPVGMI
jgi:hypothetical protein